MIAQTQLKKPSNWQDFAKLCNLLWVRYGRAKTPKNGMIVRDRINMVLMCLHKAFGFESELKLLVFATTGNPPIQRKVA